MIPFPIISNYGNIAPEKTDWWKGDELIAFDSELAKDVLGDQGEFTDYTGQTIESNKWSGSVYCTPGPDTGFEYGNGIKIPAFAYLYNKNINPTFLLDSWSLDFWTYQNPISALWNMQSTALNVSGNPQPVSSGNRFLFGAYSDNSSLSYVGIWNNVGINGSYFLPNEYKSLWTNTQWVHLAIQYDSTDNTYYLFENGIMKYSFVYANKAVNIVKFYTGINNIGSTGNVYIERYRLRSGLQFDKSGFSTKDIYN